MDTLVDERCGTDDQDEKEDVEDDGNRPVFSLVTGTYRHPKRYGGRGEAFFSADSAPFLKLRILSEDQHAQIGGTSSAVILRNQDSAIAQLDSAAGKFSFTHLSLCLFLCTVHSNFPRLPT